jgi:hypothetical protein
LGLVDVNRVGCEVNVQLRKSPYPLLKKRDYRVQAREEGDVRNEGHSNTYTTPKLGKRFLRWRRCVGIAGKKNTASCAIKEKAY